ncbi:MAG: penicillin-binding protein, partial [Spirochaetales bacterium]
MMFTGKRRTVILLFAGLLILSGAVLGTALGLSIAVNHNTRNMDELMASRPAIPSRLLDINGELITEFFSDEKRDIVPITSLPENQIYALLTREDAPFFEHKGVAVGGLFRAFIRSFQHLITGKGSLQGASTLTMQLAGSRHADRSVVKVSRKLKEIWWSFQLERRFTKQEILEQYLNTVYFGHNTYGVEAASQFFFGHSAVDNSPAESVMLVIQLAGSGLYSPFIHPNAARERQKEILNQMVDARHISTDLADSSFDNYWAGFDWSRSSSDSPYFDRLANDQAPYFTEYIRSQIDQYLFGQQDIYRDGYTIYTTLNLSYQKEAEKAVQAGLREWNEMFQNDRSGKTGYAASNLTPMIDLLSLSFGIPEIRVAGAQRRKLAQEFMDSEFTPVMDMMAMTFGLGDLKSAANISYNRARAFAKKNNVETALVTLDNRTGYILAMIGGSEFNRNNQFNRAMDAKVMPGSAFKPLYYAEAISSGQFTPATLIYDGPEVFISPDGTPYIPGNYDGKYHGNVLLRTALSKSYNIPALKILKAVGFDAAINRAAALLGITDPQEIGSTFDRVYPLGLGTLSVTPVQMARAYATMANRGQAVEPLAIRYIEDRDGNVIVNPEREMREEQERKNTQILSPQAAYIMSSLLQSTIRSGTLYYARRYVEGFDGMPMAGKTGTTQNWTNAWTMGFSPYYTTALWVGFDKQGNSLGTGMTGARTGRAWSAYMKNIHKDLPRIDFPRPETGIAERNIDIRTGMLPEEGTPEDFIRREVFIAGTQPTARSTIARFENERNDELSIKIA